MAKALLLSVVIAIIAVPFLASRDPSPQRGLKKAIFFMLLFDFLYLYAVRYIYPRLL